MIFPDLKGAYNVGGGETGIFTSGPDLILISFFMNSSQVPCQEEVLTKPREVSYKNSRQSKL